MDNVQERNICTKKFHIRHRAQSRSGAYTASY
jgi:hypothetical protein